MIKYFTFLTFIFQYRKKEGWFNILNKSPKSLQNANREKYILSRIYLRRVNPQIINFQLANHKAVEKIIQEVNNQNKKFSHRSYRSMIKK